MRNIFKVIGLIIICSFQNSYAQIELSIEEQLINSTIRIEAKGDTVINGVKGEFGSQGTGFFFNFEIDSSLIPAIVTNYHVIHNTDTGILRFTEMGMLNRPMYGSIIEEKISNFSNKWIKHPTQDLAILPLAPILEGIYKRTGKITFFRCCSEQYIPDSTISNEISAIEEVIMIGYPKGIWDSKNNLPIVRKGLTATSYFVDYLNNKQFLADIPIYEGSSGSPILILNSGIYSPKGKRPIAGTRLLLLGINSQFYSYEEEGKTVFSVIKPKTKIPLNLALIIKSETLLEFKPIIRKILNNNSP